MRTPRWTVWMATALWLSACADEPQAKPVAHTPAPKPLAAGPLADGAQVNVVLISIDTLRRDHLGVYGYGPKTSPTIDELARAGVTFDAAVAVHTNTGPAHASMMTGLYPGSHGVRRNGMKLRAQVKPLAERLAERGFTTAAFVSGWTLHPVIGLGRGFDVYDCQLHGEGRRSAPHTWAAAKHWLTQLRPKARPFFLFFHLFDPHYPYKPPAVLLKRFLAEGRQPMKELHEGLPGMLSEVDLSEQDKLEYVARYDAEIALADAAVGELLATLEAEGLRERTLVILTSDHGETLFERPWVLDHGGRAYDEQISIPLILRFPDGAHAGKRVGAQVSQVDILPTVAELLRLPVPQDEVSGRSLLRVLGEASAAPRPTFAHARPEPRRVPEISAGLSRRGLISTVRLPNAKLLEYPTHGGGFHQQLFMLDADPGETRNAASDHPQLLQTLHVQLERFRHSTDSHSRPPLPKFEPKVEAQLRALGYLE